MFERGWVLESLFFILLLFVIYTYALYPVVVIILAKRSARHVNKTDAPFSPFVSVVVAVKNEEINIEKRLKNLIEQSYPSDNYEIIVVSDGSSDRTNQLVKEYSDGNEKSGHVLPAITLISVENSQGKPNAINLGIKAAKGDIIVMSDSRQRFELNVIEVLVSNFTDPSIGAVSGELCFLEDEESDVQAQMGAYWKYEKMIRKSEAAFSSVVGVTGAIYAIRKAVYKPIKPETLIDDVLIPMRVVMLGYRVIFDDNAIAYDIVSKNSSQEWQRKVRTIAGNWQLINLMPALYSPMSNPLFFQFISHKVFRTLVPFCLPMLLLLSVTLEGGFFSFCLIVQLLGYGLALLGHLSTSLRNNKIIGFTYFFVVLNLAAVNGFWVWVTGRCNEIWRPAYEGEK